MTDKKIRKLNKDFPITGVSRADIYDLLIRKGKSEKEAEKIALSLDDINMKYLAGKMADTYCENSFWIDLEIILDFILDLEKTKRR